MLIYYIYNITTKISELHENENETYFHNQAIAILEEPTIF